MSSDARDIVPFDSDGRGVIEAEPIHELTDQKRAFAIKYVTNGYDHRKAAEEVGLSPSSASQVKKQPPVAEYIAFLQKKYLAESIVTKDVLDTMLDRLEDIAMGTEAVPMILGNGEQVTARKFHPDLVMKVYNERAKLHGLSKDEGKGSGSVNVTINMAGMTGEVEAVIEGEVVNE